ncbi:MAG: mannitol dehydrogenase family protein, partial [Ahrensia sp.]
MTRRLSARAIGITPDRRPKAGIVHLGLGAFFRAHGVSYIHQVQVQAGGHWGIIGVSLMRPAQRDLLAPQDFIYTAVEQGPDGPRHGHYDDVVDVLVAPENPAAVIDAMADPAIKIVSLTVTEKGYCLDPATGRLNQAHPDIAHDLANLAAPCSAIGFIVAALAQRKARGHRPFSVLSCDNLPSNGELVRDAVAAFATVIDPSLADWIGSQARFPATMIDRIVPATTQQDIDRIAEQTGYLDRSPVIHEPFSQWVIEDAFVDDERPPLEQAGAQFVECVAPYETMKLRCLNGSHSALAYLGFLCGHGTIYDAVSDPLLERFVRRMWQDEIVPTLKPLQAVDYGAYCEALFSRFANPAIEHKTAQIAMDGSQKLPQRLLATLTANQNAERPSPLVTIAIAAWMFFVSRKDDEGKLIVVSDALANDI